MLDEVAKKITDIPTEAIDIVSVRAEIRKTKNQIVSLSDSVIEETERLINERDRLKKIANLMITLDHNSLVSDLDTIQETEEQLISITNRLEIATEKKKLLEDIPCGSSYPACKFIRDAHVAEATIPEVESKVNELRDVLKGLNPEIVRGAAGDVFK